jgi:hypothetical protein
MRVSEDKARALLLALGYEKAMKYGPSIVAARLEKIEVDTTDRVRLAVKDAGLKRLMNSVIRAVKLRDRVELIDPHETARNKQVETFGKKVEREAQGVNEKADEGVGDEAPPLVSGGASSGGNSDVGEVLNGPAKPSVAKEVKSPPGVERAKELVIERAREEARKAAEEDAARPVRVKRTSKDEWPDLILTEKTPPGKGTIQRAVFESLNAATEDSPVTKEEVTERLVRRFPAKLAKNLKSNVDGFPHWLPKCFPFSVHQKDKRYWLAPVYDKEQK